MEPVKPPAALDYNDDRHEYRYGGELVDHVTGVLTSLGMIDLSHIPAGRLEGARSRGSRLHLITLLDDLGELDDKGLAADLIGGLACWRKFRQVCGLELIDAERPIFSERLRLAGTYDRCMKDKKGQKYLIEIKPPVVPPYTAIQLSLYELIFDDGYYKRFGVGLRPNGIPNVRPFIDRNDRNVALGALATFRWKKENLW